MKPPAPQHRTRCPPTSPNRLSAGSRPVTPPSGTRRPTSPTATTPRCSTRSITTGRTRIVTRPRTRCRAPVVVDSRSGRAGRVRRRYRPRSRRRNYVLAVHRADIREHVVIDTPPAAVHLFHGQTEYAVVQAITAFVARGQAPGLLGSAIQLPRPNHALACAEQVAAQRLQGFALVEPAGDLAPIVRIGEVGRAPPRPRIPSVPRPGNSGDPTQRPSRTHLLETTRSNCPHTHSPAIDPRTR